MSVSDNFSNKGLEFFKLVHLQYDGGLAISPSLKKNKHKNIAELNESSLSIIHLLIKT